MNQRVIKKVYHQAEGASASRCYTGGSANQRVIVIDGSG